MTEQELLSLYRVYHILGDGISLKILNYLDIHGDTTFSELRDSLKVNPSTLSKRLKLLLQVEFVQSHNKYDKLRRYYSLHENRKTIKKILELLEKLSKDI